MNTSGKIFSALCLPALLILLAGVAPADALAAKDKDKKEPPRKTRVTSTIRLNLQKKLAEIQQLAEEKKYQEALEELGDTLKSTSKPSEFERYQFYNFRGYIYYQMGSYDRALAEYQKIAKFKEIDSRFIEGAYFTIGQMHHLLGQTGKALKVLLRLEKIKTDKKDSSLYVFIAQLYYQLEQYKKGLPYVRRAIAIVKTTKPSVAGDGTPLSEEEIRKLTTPKKSWYQLLHAFYHQLGQYKKMLEVDMEWVYYYPENDTLMYLAGALSALERNKDQLSVLELLYERNHLDKESYVVQLANLEVLHGIPYKAAVMLERAMKDGVVDPDKLDNLVLLSRAWAEAKEEEKSIPPLKKAAKISESGREYDYLAKRYANLYQWDEAEAALIEAFKKGDLPNAIGSRILLGQAQGESNKFKESIKTFNKAITEINKRKPALEARLARALRAKPKDRDKDQIKRLRRDIRGLGRQLKSARDLIAYMENQLKRLAYLGRSP